MNINKLQIDKTWTLFLDRDGVINRRPMGDYVKKWADFEFLPDVTEALAQLSEIFGRIIVVTNQQGIGKGLMTAGDLENIHKKMVKEIVNTGGRIDAVYFCPDLEDKPDNCRKPGTVMAERAKKDFPEIDFSKSMMAGDTENDLLFGRNAGMKTVLINTNQIDADNVPADFVFDDLLGFAKSVLS